MSRPRIRSLKPDLWDDEALGTASIEAQCLFIGLITQADDEGRLKGSPGRLRAQLWPYKPNLDTARVDGWLDELAARDLIVRYQHEGKPHVFLPGWAAHQRITRPSDSELPPPPVPHGTLATPRDSSLSTPDVDGSPRRRSGEGEGVGETPPPSELGVASRLFEYWKQQCQHPNAKFTRDRRTKVQARLRERYTPEQIQQAIDGAARAPFVNSEGKRFDDLELICRNGSKLEDFIGRAAKSNGNGAGGFNAASFVRSVNSEPAA